MKRNIISILILLGIVALCNNITYASKSDHNNSIELPVFGAMAEYDSDYPEPYDLTWDVLGPEGGHVYAITQSPENPNEVYAALKGFPGPICKSVDFGENWERIGLVEGTALNLSVDPVDSDIIYVTAGSKVLKTTDGGQSWNEYVFVNSEEDYYSNAPISINPFNTNILFGIGHLITDNNNYRVVIFKSINSGVDWEPFYLSDEYEFASGTTIVIDPNNPDIIYCGSFAMLEFAYIYKVFKSLDGGDNWNDISGNIDSTPSSIAVDPVNSERVYVAAGINIYRSTNGGNDWSSYGEYLFADEIAIDPVNTNIIYGTSMSRIYRSFDYGVTWELNEGIFDADANGLVVNDSNNIIIGSDLGFYKSVDAGVNFTPQNSGIPATIINSIEAAPSSPNVVYIQYGDFGLMKSMNYGDDWQSITSPPRCHNFSALTVDRDDENLLHIIGGP
ncbi:MAG: hypothetical protein GY855_10965 [candidate division Zixibacteria bacterium]|nr:hypothetical protein [candidate division Zixibacteria bacterium]